MDVVEKGSVVFNNKEGSYFLFAKTKKQQRERPCPRELHLKNGWLPNGCNLMCFSTTEKTYTLPGKESTKFKGQAVHMDRWNSKNMQQLKPKKWHEEQDNAGASVCPRGMQLKKTSKQFDKCRAIL